MKNSPRISVVILAGLVGLGFLGAGCSGGGTTTSGTGGTTSSGGATSSGGTTATGGSSGSGGVTSSGGDTGSGGAVSSGGTVGSGGSVSSGGATSSGGAVSSGGTTASGGAVGSGGAAGSQGGKSGGSAGETALGGKSGAGGASMTMTLTSPVLTEGGTYPATITCAGANMSPQLDWTAGPSGTMSYAVTLTDMTNMLVHWAIWNIPSTVTSLPASLATTAMLTTPMGARQDSFSGSGYAGPCPSGTLHTYQFQVYALSTATLAGSTTDQTAARDSIKAAKPLASGTLTGTSNAKKP